MLCDTFYAIALLELERGFVAVEVKNAKRVHRSDARSLRDLEEFLDKPLLLSLIISEDRDARVIEEGVVAVPAAWLLAL